MSKTKKFLLKFFEKLTPKDFQSDKFLDNFYKTFKKEKSTELLDCYIEYLFRNRDYHANNKQEEIEKICGEIMNTMLHKPDAKETIGLKSGSILRFKLNKKYAITVLSDFIKQSAIMIYENPEDLENSDETLVNQNDDFRQNVTQTILDELKQNGIELPIAKKDERFAKRNQLLEIWQDTEYKCIKFIESDQLASIIKKTYVIDASHIKLFLPNMIKTIGYEVPGNINISVKNNELPTTDIPIENIAPKWDQTKYNTKINILNTNQLTETIHRAKKKEQCVLALAGSSMIPGGGSDQGFETNETPVYYATSYCLSVNRTIGVYPLNKSTMIISPNVIVFKDHRSDNYPLLSPTEGSRIAIITSALPYRPATNIVNQDKYNLDDRLYLPTTKYENSDIIESHYRYLFTTALFFGYNTIILDDGGIEDFWLPVHHTSEILAKIIKEYNGHFKEIVITIDKLHIYNIFKKCIQ